jgi:hypothetical protein
VTEAALSLAFFDPANDLYGVARAGTTLLYEDGTPEALPTGPDVNREDEGWRATLADRFELCFSPVSPVVELGGSTSRLCRVTGSLGELQLNCLGTATVTEVAPAWEDLDALRSISAVFDDGHAVIAEARRPRGALGHGDEEVTAWLIVDGELVSAEDARISTVYDGEGRQRAAGLELWLPDEDFPRRASGQAVAGTTLGLDGLRVNAAVFAWRMEGREGAGAYDITIRDEPEVA